MASSHAWIRGGPPPSPPPPAASLGARLRRALLGSSPNPFRGRSPSSASGVTKSRTALACLVAAALVVALAAPPPGPLGAGAGDHHLRAARNATTGEGNDADDSLDELLRALYELPLPATEGELEALNEELADLDPGLVLRWAHRRIPSPRLVQVSSAVQLRIGDAKRPPARDLTTV